MLRKKSIVFRLTAILIVGVLFEGCTTKLTYEKLDAMKPERQNSGFPYFLPKQKYTAAVVYELLRCPKDPGIPAADPPIPDDFEILQTATIIEQTKADENEQYLITYQDLDSPLKTSTFTATNYPNQTIKAIGATVDDKSSAIIKNVVGTAISVAKMILGVPQLRLPPLPCNNKTYAALNAIRNAEKILIDPAMASDKKAAAATALTHAKNHLRITMKMELVPTWSAPGLSTQLTVSDDQLKKWFSKNFRSSYIMTLANENRNNFTRSVSTQLSVLPIMPTQPHKPNDPTIATMGKKGEGIVYRDPMSATVMVCAPDCNVDNKNKKVMSIFNTQIAQLGRYRVVELENGPFDKNNVSLTFAPNGTLKSLTFGTESSLEKISGSLSDTAVQAQSFTEIRRKQVEAEKIAEESATLNILQAKIDLLNAKSGKIEAENKLRSLGGDPND